MPAIQSESLMRTAATGDTKSIAKLSEEITKLQRKHEEDLLVATLSPPPPKPPPPPTTMPTRKRKLRRLDPNYKPPPRSPIPRLPQLIESNMFPILRWPGRGVPLQISVIIKRKIVKKQKRVDLLELLEDWTVLAQEEDIFDNIIARETGVREEGGTWEHGVKSTWRDVKSLKVKEELRGMELTKRFMAIVEQRRVIRDGMILERDRERRQKKWKKYQLRKAEGKKQENEEAELLVEKEAALEGPEKTTAGEWDKGSDTPSVHYSSYEVPEHGDPEHEYDEDYGHDDSGQEYDDQDQDYEEHEYNDPEHGYEEPEFASDSSVSDSSVSDLNSASSNSHPTPGSLIPPASEPTSTSEDKP